MKKILILFFVLLINSVYAYAGEELFYTKEAINAFEEIKNGLDARKTTDATAEPRLQLADSMNNLIIQKNAIDKAKYKIDAFKNSKVDIVKQSSLLISGSLLMLSIDMENSISFLEKMLNMSEQEFINNGGTFTRKIQELAQSTNDGWRIYAQTSISVTYTLTEDTSGKALDYKISKLKIKRSEINELKKILNIKFNNELKIKDKSKIGLYAPPPLLLMDFLNGNWKASDEKLSYLRSL